MLLFPLNLNNSFSFKSLTFFSEPHYRKAHKIKGDANPYAPEWNAYFKERDKRSMNKTLADKKHIKFLWDRQNGICPVCKGEITIETRWQNHYRSWKINGGKDTSENRMLLHQTCHMQVHHGGTEV